MIFEALIAVWDGQNNSEDRAMAVWNMLRDQARRLERVPFQMETSMFKLVNARIEVDRKGGRVIAVFERPEETHTTR